MHATKTVKGAFVEVYFFRMRSIVESVILATKNLSFDRLNVFFDTNKMILVLVG